MSGLRRVRVTIGDLVARARIRDEKEKKANMEFRIPNTMVILVTKGPVEASQSMPLPTIETPPSGNGDIIRELRDIARMCALCETTGCEKQIHYNEKSYFVCAKHAQTNVLGGILEKTRGY